MHWVQFSLRFRLLLQGLVENCSDTTKSTLPLERKKTEKTDLFPLSWRHPRLGWCRQREKIDWQETRKFDCRLVRKIFIFCCPSSIFTRGWRVARKSNFDSSLDLFPLSWRYPNPRLGADNFFLLSLARAVPLAENKYDFSCGILFKLWNSAKVRVVPAEGEK